MTRHLRAFILACVLLLGLGSGCSGSGPNSFSRQIENLQWSVDAISSQRGDVDGLVLDLEMLLDPEWGQLGETFDLFGW